MVMDNCTLLLFMFICTLLLLVFICTFLWLWSCYFSLWLWTIALCYCLCSFARYFIVVVISYCVMVLVISLSLMLMLISLCLCWYSLALYCKVDDHLHSLMVDVHLYLVFCWCPFAVSLLLMFIGTKVYCGFSFTLFYVDWCSLLMYQSTQWY